jgi:hypothetical protein
LSARGRELLEALERPDSARERIEVSRRHLRTPPDRPARGHVLQVRT